MHPGTWRSCRRGSATEEILLWCAEERIALIGYIYHQCKFPFEKVKSLQTSNTTSARHRFFFTQLIRNSLHTCVIAVLSEGIKRLFNLAARSVTSLLHNSGDEINNGSCFFFSFSTFTVISFKADGPSPALCVWLRDIKSELWKLKQELSHKPELVFMLIYVISIFNLS